jgi:hypothetical protein
MVRPLLQHCGSENSIAILCRDSQRECSGMAFVSHLTSQRNI